MVKTIEKRVSLGGVVLLEKVEGHQDDKPRDHGTGGRRLLVGLDTDDMTSQSGRLPTTPGRGSRGVGSQQDVGLSSLPVGMGYPRPHKNLACDAVHPGVQKRAMFLVDS